MFIIDALLDFLVYTVFIFIFIFFFSVWGIWATISTPINYLMRKVNNEADT